MWTSLRNAERARTVGVGGVSRARPPSAAGRGWRRCAERAHTTAATPQATATDGQDRLVHVRANGSGGSIAALLNGAAKPWSGRDLAALAGPGDTSTPSALMPAIVSRGSIVDGAQSSCHIRCVGGGLHEPRRLLDREQHAAAADDPLVALGVRGVEHEVHRVAHRDDVVVVPVPRAARHVHERSVGRRDDAVGRGQRDRREAARAVALERAPCRRTAASSRSRPPPWRSRRTQWNAPSRCTATWLG